MAQGLMRTRWVPVVVLAFLVTTFMVVGPTGSGLGGSMAAALPVGIVSTFTDRSINQPFGVAAGPDGNLWFTNLNSGTIGRVTPGGVVSHFTGVGIGGPEGITAGPDGNLWFANMSTSSIGRITPAGVVSNFPAAGSRPR